jgi:pimeloyl-ACP methyl ester carboxylesterase/ketosteroid isomerase-like protein
MNTIQTKANIRWLTDSKLLFMAVALAFSAFQGFAQQVTALDAVHPSDHSAFPANFHTQEIQTDGATIHVRVGGQGPAVVLLHGFGDTGDMWAPIAAELARDHGVVVPDLRGMGLSSHPADGYDKKTQAADIRSVLIQLGIDHAAVVGHDIGATVAYAYAARYPDKTDRLVVMDAPIPGIPPWDEIVRSPALWHFSFGGPDAERLVAGREHIYLDRFWNEFAGDPSKIDEATRVHYTAFYAQPGAMHSAFAQFLSIPKDVEDNKVSMMTKLTMPVLAIGAAKMFGANEAIVMRNAADNVTEVVIANSGHWLMEEQPAATIAAVQNFLDRKTITTKSSPKGASTATQNLAAIRLGIEETTHHFEDVFNHGDAAGAASQFYTRDARVLPPGAEMVQGRDRITEFWATAAAAPQMGVRRVELSTLDLQVLGDEAYEIGRATLTLAGSKRATPKYVAVWKYEDGSWRRHVDIWNMDTP